MSNPLHRSQEGHELDKLKLAYSRLLFEVRSLEARNQELVRDVEKLTVLGSGRATNWRGWLGRHLGFWSGRAKA